MDTSAILGFKQPDMTQQLSGLLNVTTAAQMLQKHAADTQRAQQDAENEAISLRERQAALPFLREGSFINDDGTIDQDKLQRGLIPLAPTTGPKIAQDYANAGRMATEAKQALNNLTSDARMRVASVLTTMPDDADPKHVHATVDAIGKLYKGSEPLVQMFKDGYDEVVKAGGDRKKFIQQAARAVLPQETQRALNTPTIAQVDNGQQVEGINIAPGVDGYPQGSKVFGVQKQLPPTTPTVGPNNQPGYLGPQPAPEPGVKGNFTGNPDDVSAAGAALKDPQERANVQAAIAEQARRTPGFSRGAQFVPSGPVPGTNESKLGTVQGMNEHYTGLNRAVENSQTVESLISNIKSLAPQAITGTEQGRRAYVVGLLNAMGLGNQVTGQLQTDTALLEKNIAQLGLNTPASTDAMRTIVEIARPHGTMSKDAIEEAASQLLGQVKAQRALRDSLTVPKMIADKTGDPSAYLTMRSHLEQIADPRAWQYASADREARQKMLAKMSKQERDGLLEKIRGLESAGLLK